MYKLLLTAFGLGYSPFAPGTAGSLFVPIFLLPAIYFGMPLLWVTVLLVVMLIYGSWATIAYGDKLMAEVGHDPGMIVSDEVAGQALTYMGIWHFANWSNPQLLAFLFIGFFLFRLFDVTKPWPACYFDRQQSKYGVLLDDIAAGIYANIVLQIVWRLDFVENLIKL
ncbi:MAG: phosphatidylglycerophosphatase A [Phycisphaerae bacterium]|nr:phosphatidylglycerophosphatase A [Phycisphaerae bacterium]